MGMLKLLPHLLLLRKKVKRHDVCARREEGCLCASRAFASAQEDDEDKVLGAFGVRVQVEGADACVCDGGTVFAGECTESLEDLHAAWLDVGREAVDSLVETTFRLVGRPCLSLTFFALRVITIWFKIRLSVSDYRNDKYESILLTQ